MKSQGAAYKADWVKSGAKLEADSVRKENAKDLAFTTAATAAGAGVGAAAGGIGAVPGALVGFVAGGSLALVSKLLSQGEGCEVGPQDAQNLVSDLKRNVANVSNENNNPQARSPFAGVSVPPTVSDWKPVNTDAKHAAAEFIRAVLQGEVSTLDASGKTITFHPHLDPSARQLLVNELLLLSQAKT